MQTRRLKIRWRIWTVSLLFVLLIFITVFQGYWISKQSTYQIEELHSELVSKNLESLSINITNLQDQMVDFTRSFSSDKAIIDTLLAPEGEGREQRMNRQIHSVVGAYGLRIPLYVQVISGDEVYGQIALHESEKQRIKTIISAFPWYRDVEEFETPYLFQEVGKDFHDFKEDNQAFYVVQNIIYNKQRLGISVVQMDQSLVQRLMRQVQSTPSSTVLIADKSGRVILTDEENEGNEKGLSVISAEVAAHAAVRDNAGYSNSFHMNSNGLDYLCTYYTLPDTEWYLTVLTPSDSLTSPSKDIWAFTTAVVSISILLMVAAMIFFANKITLPILKLSKKMRSIQINEPSFHFDSNGIDEIDILQRGIHRLVLRINEHVEQVTKAEREKRDMELNLLQSQIKPHFLHNALNTIRWMAEMKRETSIAKAVTALMRMLEYTLNRTNSNWSTLEMEVAYLNNYVAFQEVRMMKPVEVQLNIDASALHARIPKLTLQPIVENSFLHGFARLQDRTPTLNIAITQAGDKIIIRLEDNGVGMDEDRLQSLRQRSTEMTRSAAPAMTGIGVINVIRRLELEYGSDFNIHIDSRLDAGTTITIQIPHLTPKEE